MFSLTGKDYIYELGLLQQQNITGDNRINICNKSYLYFNKHINNQEIIEKNIKIITENGTYERAIGLKIKYSPFLYKNKSPFVNGGTIDTYFNYWEEIFPQIQLVFAEALIHRKDYVDDNVEECYVQIEGELSLDISSSALSTTVSLRRFKSNTTKAYFTVEGLDIKSPSSFSKNCLGTGISELLKKINTPSFMLNAITYNQKRSNLWNQQFFYR